MIRVRGIAIAFSLASTIFWFVVQGLWSVSLLSVLEGGPPFPYWLSVIVSTAPPAVYAIAALIFCRWLARRIARQAAALEEAAE